MDPAKYRDLYLTEGREHLRALRSSLDRLRGGDSSTVTELFRRAHSLKGMAAAMGFDASSSLAHALETLMDRWRRGGDPTQAELEAATRATDTLDAMMDAVETAGEDSALADRARDTAVRLRGAPQDGEAESPKEGGQTAAEIPPSEAPKGPSMPVRLRVTVDPSSPLPAARFLVVHQHVRESVGQCRMEPDIVSVQSGNLRNVVFHLPAGPGLKDLARAVKELPEVAAVELEEAQEARPRPDAALVRSLTVASEDMDALLNHAADLLHHLTGLETALTPPEARRHRFWVEAHRSRIQRLFDQVLSARLVPFEVLSERVARGARDVEARLGKKVRFETEGVDQAVDRSLLEKLLDPLTHLVRNAVDHGIEAPEERVRAGKPEAGRLQLTVHREADALIVSLADDGRGMDPEAIRRAAVERGLFTVQEASLLDTPRLFRLLTTPAFSTRSEVTEVSGRGVGLDVVLASVESLGGHLDIASEQGKGSTFTLVIPSAATLTRILTFGWDAVPARLALPTSQVLHIYPLASHPLVWAGSRRCLQAGEELLPVLGWRLGPVGRDGCAMRLASPAGDRVLLVSRVHQTERVVVQPLGPPLDRVPGWVGAALLTTGHIAYVLDARVLVRREEENHV